ncbi:MFS transporter [Salinibacterium sp. ZJ450]|uniref:MFS transporter n=1 Tax=Salinibacterium sp. ZJ450 TaxID=2708338 RepID=UPI001423C45E|nr:MFS transporter [Salinibacterium sp. ZJ450]
MPDQPSESRAFPWFGLIVLAAAVFMSVTNEMLPTGLLQPMSRELGVSEPQIGLLLSVFAGTVVLSSIPLAGLTRRLPRHGLLVTVLIALAASNLLSAVAPTYELLVAARVFGGLTHAMFWIIVAAYAGHLVPRHQLGRAVAITASGGTLAYIFGVPLGTMLGQWLGWRLTWVTLAVLTALAAVLVLKFLPPVARETETHATRVPLRRDATLPAVVIVCLVTGLIMTGHYAFYTYIAPFITDVLALPESMIGVMLGVFGAGGAIGIVLVGTVLGRRPTGAVIGLLVSVGIAVAVLAVSTESLPIAITAFAVWGIAFGALPSLLNTRLLQVASARARDVASAFYNSAFNLGIGGGALLGAVLFDSVGVAQLPWLYIGTLLLALAVLGGTVWWRRSRAGLPG